MAQGRLRRDAPAFAAGMLTAERDRRLFIAKLPMDEAPVRAGRIVDSFLRVFSHEPTEQKD
jgi:hypothetical protein